MRRPGLIDAHHPDGQNGLFGALYEGKANPAVAVTEPRPEWYFLFLFELLRIFKSPWELIFATIIIPTILMVLLVVWPFLDRGRDRRISRRPVGMAVGLTVPAVLIALTIAGGVAPGAVQGRTSPGTRTSTHLPAAALISAHGCTTCHNFGAGGGAVGAGSLASDRRSPGPTRRPLQADRQIEQRWRTADAGLQGARSHGQQIQQIADFIDGAPDGHTAV